MTFNFHVRGPTIFDSKIEAPNLESALNMVKGNISEDFHKAGVSVAWAGSPIWTGANRVSTSYRLAPRDEKFYLTIIKAA